MSVTETAAPDLNAEVEQFFSSAEGETTPQEATADTPATEPKTTETAPAKTFWDEKIDIDDPELSPSLRNLSVREYVDKTKRALVQQHEAGMQKNAAEARAVAAEASFNAALARLQQLQPAAPAPVKQQPYEQFGLTDRNQVFEQLPNVIDQIPQMVERKARELTEPLQAQVNAMREEQQTKDYTAVAEKARADARPADIDPATWESLRPRLAAIMWAQNLPPNTPEAWGEAAKQYRSDATKMVPQQVRQEAGAPPVNGKPGTASAPKKTETTGSKRLDAEIREQLKSWEKADVKMSFDELAKMVADDPMRAGGDF